MYKVVTRPGYHQIVHDISRNEAQTLLDRGYATKDTGPARNHILHLKPGKRWTDIQHVLSGR